MVGTPAKSPTLFVPMMLGIPVLFCGVVALNPHRRKHAMHTACVIALLGAFGGGARAVFCMVEFAGGNGIDGYGLNVIIGMSLICVVFVVICIISFIQTRRRKAASLPHRAVSSISIADTVLEDDRVPDVKPRESA